MKATLSSTGKSRPGHRSKVTIRRKLASLRVCSQRRQLRREMVARLYAESEIGRYLEVLLEQGH
jgi:hypothetical protein